MERKTNVWVLENIKPEWTLESRVAQALIYITWTCDERGTPNGECCDARGDEWEEKARKAKNKMSGQCEQHKKDLPLTACMRWDARDRSKWRSVSAVVARGQTRLDGARSR